MMKKRFQYTCVTPVSLEELEYITENEEDISHEEFLANVFVEDIPHKDADIPLSEDWHVSFHQSKLADGREVFYYCHSGIEHVFY
ncbi:MAG: hypothetical protein ACOCQR_01850 [bacterium]